MLNDAKPVAKKIFDVLVDAKKPMSIEEISSKVPEKPKSTIRGRIYENLGKLFHRVSRGVFVALSEDGQTCVGVIEGDGRDLSDFEDGSMDAIITDHPWDDEKSNMGGDRKFTDTYDCFKYTLHDFKEKARVLKPGAFLVEFIPAENANNYEYLYQIKRMAAECGLEYYAKVPWKKGSFVSNTGRKSKNTEELMFFTKGKARNLRRDEKKIKAFGELHFMSGTSYMLPTMYDFDIVPVRDRIHQAEKPVELLDAVIEAVTLPGEVILDQYAGSGVTGLSALRTGRFAILIEKAKENVQKIIERLGATETFTMQTSQTVLLDFI